MKIFSKDSKKSNSVSQPENWKFTFIGGTLSQEVKPKQKRNQYFPLNQSQVGEKSIVTQIQACSEIQCLEGGKKLKPGMVLDIISTTVSGSVIVRFEEGYLGLGAAIASKVIVANC
jgi:hypothetical protein